MTPKPHKGPRKLRTFKRYRVRDPLTNRDVLETTSLTTAVAKLSERPVNSEWYLQANQFTSETHGSEFGWRDLRPYEIRQLLNSGVK